MVLSEVPSILQLSKWEILFSFVIVIFILHIFTFLKVSANYVSLFLVVSLYFNLRTKYFLFQLEMVRIFLGTGFVGFGIFSSNSFEKPVRSAPLELLTSHNPHPFREIIEPFTKNKFLLLTHPISKECFYFALLLSTIISMIAFSYVFIHPLIFFSKFFRI